VASLPGLGRRAALALALASPWALVLVACATNDLAVAGAECTLATDCQPGFVCVPQKDGKRVCSNDLTGVQRPVQPGGGNDAAMGEGGDAATDGPAVEDAPLPDRFVQDTGVPDTFVVDASDGGG
jgi:hypothetical protein